MPVDRKHYSIAERAQALTLHACGTKVSDIEKITGIKKEAFKSMLTRAKKRGYWPGGAVKDEHVQDGVKGGKPKATTKAGGKKGRKGEVEGGDGEEEVEDGVGEEVDEVEEGGSDEEV